VSLLQLDHFRCTDTLRLEYANTELKINRNALEVVAAAFALDVPSVALLSLPSSAPVLRIVHELRELGVNAHGLDLLVADKGRAHLLQGPSEASEENPVMLVSTLATTRGLDLPELTHVFMFGLPQGRRADGYLHIAGRVGRFGRRGKVITVVEEREEERREDGTVAWARDDPKRMMMLLEEIGIVPTQFEHFD
jgi:superfamily II DNA/RNA helicase